MVKGLRCWFFYHNGPQVEKLIYTARYKCDGCGKYYWQLGNSGRLQAIDPDQSPSPDGVTREYITYRK